MCVILYYICMCVHVYMYIHPPFGVRFSISVSPGSSAETLEASALRLYRWREPLPVHFSWGVQHSSFPERFFHISFVRLCVRPSGPCSLPYSPASEAFWIRIVFSLPKDLSLLIVFVYLRTQRKSGFVLWCVGTNISAVSISDFLFFLRLTF